MGRKRSGFLLPGFVLTALACLGVATLIMSAAGVLPDELPVLRSVGSGPRRNATVPVPSPTIRPSVSRTPSATPTPVPSATSGSPSASATATLTATRSPSATPTVTVTPTATRSTTPPPPPPPACKPGSATVHAAADAYVDQASPTRNFGGSEMLHVASRDRAGNRRALLRMASFTVPKGCRVTGGTLTMTARDATGRRLLVAPATMSWTESSVTWANAPSPTGTATGASVTSRTVVWSLPASTVTSAYGVVVYDAAENAPGALELTNLAARTAAGAPTLVVRWA